MYRYPLTSPSAKSILINALFIYLFIYELYVESSLNRSLYVELSLLITLSGASITKKTNNNIKHYYMAQFVFSSWGMLIGCWEVRKKAYFPPARGYIR